MKSPACVIATTFVMAILSAPLGVMAVEEKRDSIAPVRPDCNLIDKSAAIIRAEVGEAFFAEHLWFVGLYLEDTRGAVDVVTWTPGANRNAQYSARPEIYYRVDWEIRLGGSRRAAVSFDVDTAGRLLSDPSSLRLPPCALHPEACAFAVTREDARDVALKRNDVTGYEDLTEFRWSAGFQRYVWTVKLYRPGTRLDTGIVPPDGARFAIIDANDRTVLEAGPWTLFGQVAK